MLTCTIGKGPTIAYCKPTVALTDAGPKPSFTYKLSYGRWKADLAWLGSRDPGAKLASVYNCSLAGTDHTVSVSRAVGGFEII